MRGQRYLFCIECGDMFWSEPGEVTGLFTHIKQAYTRFDWCRGPFATFAPPEMLEEDWNSLFSSDEIHNT